MATFRQRSGYVAFISGLILEGMSKITPGAALRVARKLAGLTQAELGRRAGIGQSRISKFERDQRTPSALEWDRLGSCLELGGVVAPERGPRRLPRAIWRVSRPALRRVGERSAAAREAAARKTFGRLVNARYERALAIHPPEDLTLFLAQACLESSHEFMFWLQLLAESGAICWYSPLRAGFREHGVVDAASRRNISDSPLPGLDLRGPASDWLLFPQVSLQTARGCYRLDVLACRLIGKQRVWFNIEVDGAGHDAEFDLRRQSHLGLPTIRLTREQVGESNLLRLLESLAAAVVETRLGEVA